MLGDVRSLFWAAFNVAVDAFFLDYVLRCEGFAVSVFEVSVGVEVDESVAEQAVYEHC